MTIELLVLTLTLLMIALVFRRQWYDVLSELRDEFLQRRIDARIRHARARPLGPPRHPTLSSPAPGGASDAPADVQPNAGTSGD